MNERSSSTNKNIMWIIIVVVVVIGGGWYIANQQSQKAEQAKMEQEKAAMMQKEDTAMKQKQEKEAMMKKDSASRYLVYSKPTLDQAADKRRVLYFYASWCPICRPANADFEKNAGKFPKDLVVIRVNYNDPDTDQEEKDLAKKYGITYQHTFVQVDSTGKEITRWSGGQTEELLANIK